MKSKTKKLLLKDQLFNKENVKYLANLIKKVCPEFDSSKFEKEVLKKFPKLELKERMYWIRENIENSLPGDYKNILNILIQSLETESGREDFIFSVYSDYAAVNGCNRKDLDTSLNALGEFTKYFSAEFAIRPFINKFPEETFIKLREWSFSDNVYQRRLASEGLRPKLPWAKSINFDYKRGSEVLDNLFYDKNRSVTRSVANHLNDISKIDPDFVVERLDSWKKSGKQNDREMNYIIQHSLRTSVKRGEKKTLNFLGYNSNPKIKIQNFKIAKEKIVLGEAIGFSFQILSEKNENVIIDYKIIYPMLYNKCSEKVFKLKKTVVIKGEIIQIEKKHFFKKMTTKKLYSGNYKLQIQINGGIVASTEFQLKVPL